MRNENALHVKRLFILLSPVKLHVDSSGKRMTETLDFHCRTFYYNCNFDVIDINV